MCARDEMKLGFDAAACRTEGTGCGITAVNKDTDRKHAVDPFEKEGEIVGLAEGHGFKD